MTTAKEITMSILGTNSGTFTIPAGVRCVKATNLPPDEKGNLKYWACGWRGMPAKVRAIKNSIGILLTRDEVLGK